MGYGKEKRVNIVLPDGTVKSVSATPAHRLKEYGGCLERHTFNDADREKSRIACHNAYVRRKKLKENLQDLLAIDGGRYVEELNMALLAKAIQGDTKAYEIVRDTVGEKPKDEVVVEEKTINVTLE